MMKKILSLLAVFLTLMACTKEEVVENYSLPSITMDSCVVTSGNSFTAYMTVDKGESFFNHSLQLLVYDAKDAATHFLQPTWSLEMTVCKKFRKHLQCRLKTTNI